MLSIDQIIKNNQRMVEAQKEESKRRFYKNFGFSDRGYTWVATQKVITDDERGRFKAQGGWFDRFLGWHSPRPITGFKTLRIHFDQIVEWKNGMWMTQKYKVETLRREAAKSRLTKRDALSKFIGKINEVTSFDARLIDIVETPFVNDMFAVGGMEHYYNYYFRTTEGDIARFGTAWYDPEKVRTYCGKNRLLHIEAKVAKHYDGYGRCETTITYPKITRKGMSCKTLADCARILKKDGNAPTEAEESKFTAESGDVAPTAEEVRNVG